MSLNPYRMGWRADCPACVASKFTCDKHYFKPSPKEEEAEAAYEAADPDGWKYSKLR